MYNNPLEADANDWYGWQPGDSGEPVEEPEDDIPEQAEHEDLDCPVCDGPLLHLGILGQLTYYRCQNCGVDVPLTLVQQFNV